MHKPTDRELTQALADFQPQPSNRFYMRMESAPWRQQRYQAQSTHNILAPFLPRSTLGIVGLSLATFCLVIILTPPLRTAAQEWLGLMPKHQDDLWTLVERQEWTQSAADIEPIIIEPETAAFLEAKRLAGFTPWQPAVSPPGYYLETILYMPLPKHRALFSTYRNPVAHPFNPAWQPSFSLYQEDASTENTLLLTLPVGASAEVEIVHLGDITGEYVEGFWRGPSSSSPMEWHPSTSSRTLVWQQAGFNFRLEANGSPDSAGALDKQEMITLARNLQPLPAHE